MKNSGVDQESTEWKPGTGFQGGEILNKSLQLLETQLLPT